jgi:hypothetical protein
MGAIGNTIGGGNPFLALPIVRLVITAVYHIYPVEEFYFVQSCIASACMKARASEVQMKGKTKQKKSEPKRDTQALIHQITEGSPAAPVPVLLSVDECFEMTGVSRWSWRSWAYSGKVESIKMGKLLKIPASEVARLIEAGRRPRIVA